MIIWSKECKLIVDRKEKVNWDVALHICTMFNVLDESQRPTRGDEATGKCAPGQDMINLLRAALSSPN